MPSAPKLVPVALDLPTGEAWGRLLELHASGASACLQAPVSSGDSIVASFEAGGESFEMTGRVLRRERDQDGYVLAELLWTDEVVKRRLARVLADLLSRAP